MRIPWHSMIMATGLQGVGVYVHRIIENNSDPGTVQRWVFCALPVLVGMATPLAIELVDLVAPEETNS